MNYQFPDPQEIVLLLMMAFSEPQTDSGIRDHMSASDFFEGYEEVCLGWDGETYRKAAEDAGICRYFEQG